MAAFTDSKLSCSLLAFFLVFYSANCQYEEAVEEVEHMCNFLPPERAIDWSRVHPGPWKWAAYTPDELQESLVCSDVTISGSQENRTFLVDMKYGEGDHQSFFLRGNYSQLEGYKLLDFTSTWKSIVAYRFSKTNERQQWGEELDDVPRKEEIMFYTDYRNYFINVICLPSGRVSVAALTRHKKVSWLLLKRIYNVLYQNYVQAIPAKALCTSPEPKLKFNKKRGKGK